MANKSKPGQGLNSSSFLVNLAASASDHASVPENVNLNEAEAKLWPQFACARTRGDWREFDLILLAKIVKLEVNIRKYQDMFDQTGAIIKNPKGTPIANPLLNVIDVLTRQQMSIIRSLSLTTPAGDPRTATAHALQARTFNAILKDDTDGLLARPN